VKKMTATAMIALIGLVVGMAACNDPDMSAGPEGRISPDISAGPEGRTSPETQLMIVNAPSYDDIEIILPNGQVAKTWDEFSTLARQQEWNFEVLEITADIAATSVPADSAPAAKEQVDIKFGVGQYFVRVSWEWGFIGCFQRAVNHLGAMVSYKGVKQPIVDLHLAAWTNGDRVCFGIYESASKFCWKDCTPSWKEIRDTIAQTLIVAGVSYATAYIIANVLATLSVAAFAL